MIMSDKWIKEKALEGMITPFTEQTSADVTGKVISYGLSSYGYDVRLAPEFKVFTNLRPGIVDPKRFDEQHMMEMHGDTCIIPPNSFILGRSIERIKVPRDILIVCLGKSTYARCGIVANVTPLEPEWEGYITLELSNTTNLPAKVYAHEGVVQLLFLQGNEPCMISYEDKKGKYQNQVGVVSPRL